jgi:putative transcriptional regulator
MQLKNRIRSLRAERGWSQADLAGRLGVSRQTVNAVEAGRSDPSLPMGMRMARLFDRRVEEVFSLDDASAAWDMLAEQAGG